MMPWIEARSAHCDACARVLVETPRAWCGPCALMQRHIRRGAAIATGQQRLERRRDR